MCKIKMAVDTMVLDKVMLMPDQLLMYDKEETATLFEDMEYEDTDLTMFTIKSLDLVQRNVSRPEKGIMMRIVLKRKATTELMTTYLPTLLLLLLTFSGTFFKVELFGDAMAHNLTIILVMTTIFTSKIQELPPTSDTKMIDFWLIFCQLYPFAEVILLTLMEYNRVDGDIGNKGMNKDASSQGSGKWVAKGQSLSEDVPVKKGFRAKLIAGLTNLETFGRFY